MIMKGVTLDSRRVLYRYILTPYDIVDNYRSMTYMSVMSSARTRTDYDCSISNQRLMNNNKIGDNRRSIFRCHNNISKLCKNIMSYNLLVSQYIIFQKPFTTIGHKSVVEDGTLLTRESISKICAYHNVSLIRK